MAVHMPLHSFRYTYFQFIGMQTASIIASRMGRILNVGRRHYDGSQSIDTGRKQRFRQIWQNPKTSGLGSRRLRWRRVIKERDSGEFFGGSWTSTYFIARKRGMNVRTLEGNAVDQSGGNP